MICYEKRKEKPNQEGNPHNTSQLFSCVVLTYHSWLGDKYALKEREVDGLHPVHRLDIAEPGEQ